ncbi:sugar ABC transporter permease [soil metagenome]
MTAAASGSPPAFRITNRLRESFAGYSFLAPQFLGFVFFAFVPVIQVFWLSFNQINPYTGATTFIGGANYLRFFQDPALPEVLATTGVYVFGLTLVGTSLAMFLAVLVNQKLAGISIFRAIFFIPALVTLAAWTLAWSLALQPGGIVDGILAGVGIGAPNWLNTEGLALGVVIVLQALKNVGINMMILLAALQSVPAELQEAARMDGASSQRVFWKITLPMVSPSVFMVSILMLVGSFKAFEQIYLLTHGGPGRSTTVLSFYIYQQAFVNNDQGYASALAALLFVLVLALTGLVWLARRKLVFFED